VPNREYRQPRRTGPIQTWRQRRDGKPNVDQFLEALAAERARRAPEPVARLPVLVDQGRRLEVAPGPALPSRPAAVQRFRASRSSTWRKPDRPAPPPHELLAMLHALLGKRPRGIHRARAVVEAAHYAAPVGLEWAQARRVLPGIAKWLRAAQRPWMDLGRGAARRAARRVVPWGLRALKSVRPLLAARAAEWERRQRAGVS
jgi:hypothetical protein